VNVLDLFSGIGGFSVGLERAGMQTAAFCETNPFCRRVLKERWPGARLYGDVRYLTAKRLASDGIAIDLVAGGFPCQEISYAGVGGGMQGRRSGLWRHYARIIGEVRPQFAIVENVSALLDRGLGDVLGDLAALGYDAEWHCVPASAVGAPHQRDRVWIVAYPECWSRQRWARFRAPQTGEINQPSDSRADMADAGGSGLSLPEQKTILGERWWEARRAIAERGWWAAEPDMGRMAHGVASRVDRLRAIGNGQVPAVAALAWETLAP